MSIKIEETFRIQAPLDRVWRYFTDPQQVVTCLPGAELTEVQEHRTYLGRVKVKVGPVTAAYNGKATIVDQDDVAHEVRLVAEGRETAGSGSAKMTMTSRMKAHPEGGTEVHVVADVDVVGKIVQFGRGMIESVNKQLFRQFLDCARGQLETPDETAASTGAGASTGDASAGTPGTGAGGVALPAAAGAAAFASVPAPTSPAPRAAAAPAGAGAAPVKVLPLMLRALWDMVLRLFRRRPA